MRPEKFEVGWKFVGIVFVLLLFFYFISYLQAAAVGTLTTSQGASRSPVTRIVLNWTSFTDGTVSGTLTQNINGRIVGVITDPGAAAPTDNYDITLLDANGFDVLFGRGADRDTVNTERFCPGQPITDGTTTSVIPVAVNSTLELRVANAGSTKNGQVIILLQ
jgi:hypothetical protein